jgi:hypothetical protein
VGGGGRGERGDANRLRWRLRREAGDLGELGSRPALVDLNDDCWNELDDLHEQLRQSRADRGGIASLLGGQIHAVLQRATNPNSQLGEQRRAQLEERYAPAPDPQKPLRPLRVVVRAEHSAAVAAAEIRKLGDAFARAIGEELRK